MTAIPVIDAVQAADWDARARRQAKIPSRVLMESAGRGVASAIVREFGSGPGLAYCVPGNGAR